MRNKFVIPVNFGILHMTKQLHRSKIMPYSLDHCPQCFEDKESFPIADAMGIHLGYVCDSCHNTFIKKFKPEIFKGNYESMSLDHGERIDEIE